jgi:predicted kinase
MEEPPVLVVVTGLPGTGKSTVADAIAGMLGTAVLAHDWAMSGLRPYPEVQAVLDTMEPSGHRVVGWSILCALARAQLRQGRSVVLDGVARSDEVEACQHTAREESARCLVVATHCSDPARHRARVEGRQRRIPNWYELDWSHVAQAIPAWVPPERAALTLDAADEWSHNESRLRALFG